MIGVGSTTLNFIIASFVYSWIFSIAFGLILSVSFPLFRKKDYSSWDILIPFYNIFELCNIVGMSEFMGLLFLIPGVNFIMIMVCSYKLKNAFDLSSGFSLGLLFMPGLFIPILAYTNINEKSEKPAKEVEVKDIKVDSIFKANIDTVEISKTPYKAKKVQVNEKFINSGPAEAEKIEKVKK